MTRFIRIGHLVAYIGPIRRRCHPIGCGCPHWRAHHVWWRLYRVDRRKPRVPARG